MENNNTTKTYDEDDKLYIWSQISNGGLPITQLPQPEEESFRKKIYFDKIHPEKVLLIEQKTKVRTIKQICNDIKLFFINIRLFKNYGSAKIEVINQNRNNDK